MLILMFSKHSYFPMATIVYWAWLLQFLFFFYFVPNTKGCFHTKFQVYSINQTEVIQTNRPLTILNTHSKSRPGFRSKFKQLRNNFFAEIFTIELKQPIGGNSKFRVVYKIKAVDERNLYGIFFASTIFLNFSPAKIYSDKKLILHFAFRVNAKYRLYINALSYIISFILTFLY